MRIFWIVLAIACTVMPAQAQPSFADAFELPNTWRTKFGDTPAELLDWWNNQALAGSAALITDLRGGNNNIGMYGPFKNITDYSTRYVVSDNSDPLVTLKYCMNQSCSTRVECTADKAIPCARGWHIFRLPAGQETAVSEGHLVVINEDDPNWLWDLYGVHRYSNGDYAFWGEGKRWARTRAAGDSTPYADDGPGTGSIYTFTQFHGGTTACPASAARALGSIHPDEIDAGRIEHAIWWIIDGESGYPHVKRFPCRDDQTNVTNSRTNHGEEIKINGVGTGEFRIARVNAPHMGERLMLNPSYNCAAITSPLYRIKCVALQEYGAILGDTGGENEIIFDVAAPASEWAGYNINCTASNCGADTLLANMRWVAHPEAWPGESTGASPPLTFPDSLPVITTTQLANGAEGEAYDEDICVVGGTGPYVWDVSVPALPTGLALGTPSGQCVPIEGTPTVDGTYAFTIRVTDASMDVDTQAFTGIVIADVPPVPPAGHPPVSPGVLTLVGPFGNALVLQPATITAEWVWDTDFINSGTLTISGSCDLVSWDVLSTPAYNANFDVNTLRASVVIDPAALKIGACPEYTLEIAGLRNGNNWGSRVTIRLLGRYFL